MTEVATKLAAARTRLVLDKPFLGALVLRLPLIETTGNWCTTSATDARSLYYNLEYIEPLSLSQVQFVLAHEAMHCGLSHFARREHRNLNRWNLACDYAVNQLLIEDGLELPPGALFNDEYKGLSAEEIYPLIKKDTEEQTMDQHLYDGQDGRASEVKPDQNQQPSKKRDQAPLRELKSGGGKESANGIKTEPEAAHDDGLTSENNVEPESKQALNQGQDSYAEPHTPDSSEIMDPNSDSKLKGSGSTLPPAPLSATERERLNTQWQQRLAGAAQQATVAGKMSGSVARMINQLLRSSVPWRNLLARFMSGTSRTDYNLMRPSQRRSGDAILPSLHSKQTNVLIAIDTSGSIEQDEITEFITEINAIKGLVNARITLLACDSELDDDGPWIYESWEQLALPKTLKGDGGTDFVPVFDWMKLSTIPPDLLIYFTDAKGRFPRQAPGTETLWLVKGPAEVPWGQRIQLN